MEGGTTPVIGRKEGGLTYGIRYRDGSLNWGYVFVFEAAGILSAESDFGNFGYRWHVDALPRNYQLREFLVNTNRGYILDKLSRGEKEVNTLATQEVFLKYLEKGKLPKGADREFLTQWVNRALESDFTNLYAEMYHDPRLIPLYDLIRSEAVHIVYKVPTAVENFHDRILKPIMEVWKKELEEEKKAALLKPHYGDEGGGQ